MRFLLLAVLCLCSVPANAAVYNLPLNGTVTVLGDFKNKSINVEITLFANAILPPENNTSALVVWTDVNSVSFSGGVTNLIGGGCHYPSCFGGPVILWGTDDETLNVLDIHTSYFTWGPSVSNITIAIHATLPDGYSIAAPVPELPTWAMLLIGFTVTGVWRLRRLTSQT